MLYINYISTKSKIYKRENIGTIIVEVNAPFSRYQSPLGGGIVGSSGSRMSVKEGLEAIQRDASDFVCKLQTISA